jgi:purine-nucleoside phosphorylase
MVPTPHIGAKEGAFAKTVLMPGDPLRAKFIAEHFLENPVLVNEVRGMLGYTGTYHGKKVSVMGSGMGMPSIGIYSYELFHFYDVDAIIRIGSAGGIGDQVKLRDVVMGIGACTDSNFADHLDLAGTIAPICDFSLAVSAMNHAKELGISLKAGNLLSSDVFYDGGRGKERWKDLGVLAVEMEAAALYLNALEAKKKALCLCTISDHIFTGESLSSEDRQTTFTDMMKLALEIATES